MNPNNYEPKAGTLIIVYTLHTSHNNNSQVSNSY